MKESDSITAHLNERTYFPAVSTRYDDRQRAKSSIADEHSSTLLGNLRYDRMQRVG
jgi:hypothetical protein